MRFPLQQEDKRLFPRVIPQDVGNPDLAQGFTSGHFVISGKFALYLGITTAGRCASMQGQSSIDDTRVPMASRDLIVHCTAPYAR